MSLFSFSVCFKIILPEKTALENSLSQNLVSLSEKISEYAADMKTLFKGLIHAFFWI